MMRNRRATSLTALICLLAFVLPCSLAGAQGPPEIDWTATFGGSGLDRVNAVAQTTDGGYVFVGGTMSEGAGHMDVWLVKTDADGNEEWNRTYGTVQNDQGFSVQQTTDEGYIITGYVGQGSGAPIHQLWVAKANEYGALQWSVAFTHVVYEGYELLQRSEGYSVQQTADGGYVVTGLVIHPSVPSQGVWLLKLGPGGGLSWQRIFHVGGPPLYRGAAGRSVEQTSDGGFIIAGSRADDTFPAEDIWLIKTDPDGYPEWDASFGRTYVDPGGYEYLGNEWAYTVHQAGDLGYIVAGVSQSWFDTRGWVIKTDSLGERMWDRAFVPRTWVVAAQQALDGQYVIFGSAKNSHFQDTVWLTRLDGDGDTLWEKQSEGWWVCDTTDGLQTRDGGYVAVANVTGGGAYSDVWLVRFAPEALPPNQPPVADAGGLYAPYEGETTILDASESFDPDGVIALYEWDLDGDGEYDDATGIAPDVTYSDDGTYPIGLRVTDEYGESDTDVSLVIAQNVSPTADADPSAQMVQYSDAVSDVTVAATDVAADPLDVSACWSVDGGSLNPGLPDGLALTAEGCTISEGTNLCTWTLSGTADVSVGAYTVRVAVSDDDGGSTEKGIAIFVEPEDATLHFHGGNPVALRMIEGSDISGPFELTVDTKETYPDAATDPLPGDISLTGISMQLVPIGPGGGAIGVCATDWVDGTGYDAVKRVTCSFDGILVNTYAVQVTDINGYYVGRAEDVLTVYDPTSGFATGGGTFSWPDTGEETNFGFTMEYNKKGTKVKGSLMLVRHVDDGSVYSVKSNALYGMSMGQESDYSWASFSGKAVYLQADWPEPEGNHEFVAYVEDGTEADRFWIEVKGKDREVIPEMSMVLPTSTDAMPLTDGEIILP